jgi:hypothetical protein
MACFPNGWNRLPAGKIRHLAGFRSHLQRVTSPGFDRNRKPWPTHVPHQSHSARNKSLHFVACPKPGGRKRIAQRFIAGLAHPSVTSPVRDERIVCVPTPPAPCFGLRPSRRDLVAQVSQPAASPLQRCSAYGKTPAFISNQHAGMNAKGVPSFSPGLRASATWVIRPQPSTLKGLHRFRNPSQIFCFPCDCAKTGLKGRHRTAWGNALGMAPLSRFSAASARKFNALSKTFACNHSIS